MAVTSSDRETGILSKTESRSIDYVPHSERGGRLFDQATIWFAGSAQLLTLATGTIGIFLGLNLGWTLIALAVGTILGTIPVSAHATQGPHLGLPQMVQSRPQFGRYGALFIWAMAIVVYWGYIVLGGDLMGATAAELTGGGHDLWVIAVCAVACVLAIFGYHWLHVAQRVVTVALLIVILIYAVGLALGGRISAELFDLTESFSWGPFIVVVSAATGYQLTWAFFVSDYSRYMPADTRKSAIVWMTSMGLFWGLFTFMAIGAIGASLLPDEGIVTALRITGGYVFPGLGEILLVTGGLGLLGLTAMCAYGGSLTLITAMDSVRQVAFTRRLRVVTILLIGITGTVAALVLPEDFLYTSFYTVLILVGYVMAPWTSVNLTDFFLVRRGHYSITEMFKVDGVYGFWNWRGLVAYFGTLLIMVPFMYLPGYYEGPVWRALGEVDIAFFVGIPIGAVVYWALCRSQDFEQEHAIVADSDKHLESVGQPIE